MGKAQAKLYTSAGAMMERVTSGEHLIAYGIFGSYALGRSKKDPNLGIILPKDYTMVTSRVAFISKKAKNPNAGKLFLDYILSKRGQEIIANKADLYSLRSDVDGEATIKGVTQLIGDKARPVPIDQTLLGESRPGQTACLPVEVAAGEEGAIGIARRPSGAPDQGQPCPLSCTACSCSASPRLSWWRRCRLWSTRASSPRRFSILRQKSACSPIRSCFADPDFWQAFWTTIAIAGGMAAIAVPLGALLAFLMVRTDVPGRQYLEPLILIPIFVSAVVIAFGYVVAIGPVGIFSTLAKDVLGFVPWNLYSLLALIMIAGLTHVPHVYLYSAAALRGLSTDLEEAARVSGANPFRVARQCQPADDPAGDFVCRRAGVLSGL